MNEPAPVSTIIGWLATKLGSRERFALVKLIQFGKIFVEDSPIRLENVGFGEHRQRKKRLEQEQHLHLQVFPQRVTHHARYRHSFLIGGTE